MRNTLLILIALIVLIFIGMYAFGSRQATNDVNVNVAPGQDEVPAPTEPELTIAQVTDEQIVLSNGTTISISQFPDEVQVSADAAFGSSDRIKAAVLSPDERFIAVAVAGAAHDFGWVYEVATEELSPVVFSYGGGVELDAWLTNSRVQFSVTSPEPRTTQKVVDVTNLPQYPL